MPASERPLEDVQVYGVQKRKGDRIKRPWIVRWSLDGRQRSRSFRTKAEADRYRAGLLLSQQRGERFDDETGEPVSWAPSPGSMRTHEWARTFVAEQWHEWQPRTRSSAVEALARFVPMVAASAAPSPPDGLRGHLTRWLRADEEPGEECEEQEWLDRWVLSLDQLDSAVLSAADTALGQRDDGQPLAATTANRYRTVAKACVRRAVELEHLASDPWPPAPKGRARRKASRKSRAINVRQLPDPETMATIIDEMASHQPGSRVYQAMTAVAYYAGLRPSEVVMLRRRSLTLPDDGWGRIEVTEADIAFDEPGEPKTGERSVPIPAVLVEILRTWLEDLDPDDDSLLFRTRNDTRPSGSNWVRALHRACRNAGQREMRVYDCRHAAATTWLRAGVPLGEVAKRMGHSVETLVSTYVGALDGDEAMANDRIDASLGL